MTVEYPNGYTVLPYAGGWKDQPHRIYTLFDIFLNAERRAAMERLK